MAGGVNVPTLAGREASPAAARRQDLNSENRPAAHGKPALNVITSAPRSDEAFSPATSSGVNDADLGELAGKARSEAILAIILSELDSDKAEEIVTINLGGKTDIADAMVVASGRSARHVGALAEKFVKRLKDANLKGARIEGVPACDWVLIDAEDVIVHLFRPEVRKFYNLERIWSETARAPLQTDH